MPVSDYYEALVFEDGKKFNVSRTVNTGIKQIAFLPSVQALFKRYTNMTFVDYLTTERVRRAEAISMDPSRHITDIAFEYTFNLHRSIRDMTCFNKN